jgi:hypothetical protein
MQFMQRMVAGHGTWVRRFEHLVLRLVALAFSLASAHAILWVRHVGVCEIPVEDGKGRSNTLGSRDLPDGEI